MNQVINYVYLVLVLVQFGEGSRSRQFRRSSVISVLYSSLQCRTDKTDYGSAALAIELRISLLIRRNSNQSRERLPVPWMRAALARTNICGVRFRDAEGR